MREKERAIEIRRERKRKREIKKYYSIIALKWCTFFQRERESTIEIE